RSAPLVADSLASTGARAGPGRLRFRRRLGRRHAGCARQGRILTAAARAFHAGLPRVPWQAATLGGAFAGLRRGRGEAPRLSRPQSIEALAVFLVESIVTATLVRDAFVQGLRRLRAWRLGRRSELGSRYCRRQH